MTLCQNIQQTSQSYFDWVFPPKIELPDCVMAMLEQLFPNIDWNKVQFHQGLPWFTSDPITLPGTYDFSQVHVFIDEYDFCNCGGRALGLIVHESFHVQQYFDTGNVGVGFFRPFMYQYLACWMDNGFNYDGHPMEADAYDLENKFSKCCRELERNHNLKFCNCEKDDLSANHTAIEQFLSDCEYFPLESANHEYDCGTLPLIGGILLDLILTILKPVVELILGAVGGVIKLFEWIVCGLTYLWAAILGFLDDACNWAIELEKQCTEWYEERIQVCQEEADQGHSACAEEEDQGYSACAEQQDQGYKDCCDWWPCRVLCKAWVWISNWVCVAWTWIVNMVCVLWTWIENWVCIAWATVVNWVCKAFTWVIKKITCW